MVVKIQTPTCKWYCHWRNQWSPTNCVYTRISSKYYDIVFL